LERENNYLHHAVGTSDEAVLVIVTNGPLEEIGRIAHSMGARDALVVENGGSVQIGYRRRDGSWRPIFESYYFREPSIALAVYELRQPGEGEFVFTGDWTLGATT
jgi:hydroxymethylpyrimidine pyrophosphatase-like HAD family hydrolase